MKPCHLCMEWGYIINNERERETCPVCQGSGYELEVKP